ncbi:MAG: cyclic nucleotide-binding domain-containing protein [Acidimicrobiales bacterium]
MRTTAPPLVPGIERDALVGCGTTLDLPAGTVLCHAGERGTQVFVILAGSVAVTNAAGRVADLGPGDVVGELAVLAARPRNADAVALTDVTVVVFTPAEFAAVRERDPRFATAVDDVAATRAA